MLFRELKELEIHELIKRTVDESSPTVAEYNVTGGGKSLKDIVSVLQLLGQAHRNRIMR
jgi:DNA-binding HxlR family transcriptional regulator